MEDSGHYCMSRSDGFQQFLDSLKEPDRQIPILSPKRFSDALNIDLGTLAQRANVHRTTVSRAPASKSVQDYMRKSLRVIRAATDRHGDVACALFWYCNEPLPEFEYKTAEILVAEGRVDDMIRFVSSLDAGAAG